MRGHVSLGDLEDAGIELPVDTDAYNSIGGYVFNELGRLPKRGDEISADGHTIRVESVRENRIVALRIHAHAPQPGPRGGRRRRVAAQLRGPPLLPSASAPRLEAIGGAREGGPICGKSG